MTAREYFDGLRVQVLRLAARERLLEAIKDARGISGKASGVGDVGGGGGGGACAADREIDAEIELNRMRAELNAEVARATCVLYGRSGRGGVALARGSASADAVCGYYLMGMTWRQVAEELVMPDSGDGAHWCRNRANAALRHIDKVGMARLVDS